MDFWLFIFIYQLHQDIITDFTYIKNLRYVRFCETEISSKFKFYMGIRTVVSTSGLMYRSEELV